MKKVLYSMLCGTLAVTLFTACGGGSSSSAGSAGKTGSLTSEVEAIIADNQAADKEIQQKLEKLGKAENPDVAELTKLAEKKQQLDKDSEAKLDAAAKKLVNKELTFELSEGLFYSIASRLTVTEAYANGKEAVAATIPFRIKINDPLTIAKGESANYPVCYKYMDAGGNVIGVGLVHPFGIAANREAIELKAEQTLDKEFKLSYDQPKYGGACKVVFISKEEYDTLKK